MSAVAWPFIGRATRRPVASVFDQHGSFGTVEAMTESESAEAGPGTQALGDALAARLLAAQRLLCAPGMDPDVRNRLHLRYMAICTSLKMPAANMARGEQRLRQLIADAERALGGDFPD